MNRLTKHIEEWIKDKTRFAIDWLSRQRLDKVYIREDNKLNVSDWDNALDKIKNEINKRGKDKTITLSGKFTDAETIIAAKLFSEGLGSDLYDAFNSKDAGRVASKFTKAVVDHVGTITGIWIGPNPGTPPPIAPVTWSGLM